MTLFGTVLVVFKPVMVVSEPVIVVSEQMMKVSGPVMLVFEPVMVVFKPVQCPLHNSDRGSNPISLVRVAEKKFWSLEVDLASRGSATNRQQGYPVSLFPGLQKN